MGIPAMNGLVSRRRFLVGAGAAGGAAALGVLAPPAFAARRDPRPEDFDAGVAASWFDLQLVLVRTTPGFSPPVASRAFAYSAISLYEAIVRGSNDYESLERELPGLRGLPGGRRNLHWPTVANAALARIARSLFATTNAENLAAIDALESSFAERFRDETGRQVFRASVERGRDVAPSHLRLVPRRRRPRGLPAQLPAQLCGPGWSRSVGAHPARIPAGSPTVLGHEPVRRSQRRGGLPLR
jgi:hypothetical protein